MKAFDCKMCGDCCYGDGGIFLDDALPTEGPARSARVVNVSRIAAAGAGGLRRALLQGCRQLDDAASMVGGLRLLVGEVVAAGGFSDDEVVEEFRLL